MPSLAERSVCARCARLPRALRLGLTARPERTDGREAVLAELIGPTVCRRDIVELAGTWLSDYDTERVEVELAPLEREDERERGVYLDFIRRHGIRMSDPRGWGEFVMLSSRSAEGRRAMAAYMRQRELAFTGPRSSRGSSTSCLCTCAIRASSSRRIRHRVRGLAAVSLPCITHQTKVKECSMILRGLSDGTYGAVVTSRVLNEGVDVPDANVAVVLSGSGSVREHVQRLGRVLRRREGKRAILYELVTKDTIETRTSDRRREHRAYRNS